MLTVRQFFFDFCKKKDIIMLLCTPFIHSNKRIKLLSRENRLYCTSTDAYILQNKGQDIKIICTGKGYIIRNKIGVQSYSLKRVSDSYSHRRTRFLLIISVYGMVRVTSMTEK